MLYSNLKFDIKLKLRTGRVLDVFQLPAHQGCELARQVEADTMPCFLVFGSSEVRREELLNIFRVDTRSIILNRNRVIYYASLQLFLSDDQANFPINFSVLERVRYQVDNNLLGAELVNVDKGLLLGHGDQKLDLLHVNLAFEGLYHRHHDILDKSHGFGVEHKAARLD